MFKIDDYSRRVMDLKGTKLLNFRFPNRLLIRSGLGTTILKDERAFIELDCDGLEHTYNYSKDPRLVRVCFEEATNSRDYYMLLVRAAKKLGLYAPEVDGVLQDIVDYRWSRGK